MSNKENNSKELLIDSIERSIISFKKDIISNVEIQHLKKSKKNAFRLMDGVRILTDEEKENIYLVVHLHKPIKAFIKGEFTKDFYYIAIDIKRTNNLSYKSHISSLEKIDCLPWLFSELILNYIYGYGFINLIEKLEWLLDKKEEIALEISKNIWGNNYLEFFEEKMFCFNYFSEKSYDLKTPIHLKI